MYVNLHITSPSFLPIKGQGQISVHINIPIYIIYNNRCLNGAVCNNSPHILSYTDMTLPNVRHTYVVPRGRYGNMTLFVSTSGNAQLPVSKTMSFSEASISLNSAWSGTSSRGTSSRTRTVCLLLKHGNKMATNKQTLYWWKVKARSACDRIRLCVAN